jgi:hypothetical protein
MMEALNAAVRDLQVGTCLKVDGDLAKAYYCRARPDRVALCRAETLSLSWS